MSKGIVVHLDDDRKGVLDISKNYFDQLGTGLEYLCCTTSEEFITEIKNNSHVIKALVFDLVNKSEEGVDLKTVQTEFIKELKKAYEYLRVPIFIFSAHLSEYTEFIYSGTIFRFDKGNGKFEDIADKIKLFAETGFLDLFCANGEIERLLLTELHDSFTKQFSSNQNGNDIEGIIASLKANGGDITSRTKEVFTRIALRSLLSSLMIDKAVAEGVFDEAKVSAVEHYIRRINRENVPIWTGDIFANKKNEEKILVLAPRCDLASGRENLLICFVQPAAELKKGDADKFMKDNIQAKRLRYLPKTSVFEGGKVDLSEHRVIPKKAIEDQFDYLISLSDELTNEILAKFCAYLLRTSLPEVDPKELQAFFN